MTPAAVLADALDAALGGGVARIGAAVSGGGDSMALMALLAEWGRATGVAVAVATVDHGLRAEAAAEADLVARTAAGLGLPHTLLRWSGWDGQGNLQAAARAARYRLLGDWAGDAGIGHVCLAHTRDDQAETVLLRLARGSGVDGLAAMGPVRRDAAGMVWLRPLLGVGHADLRSNLIARGIGWVEDPSNADMRFDRVKARQLLASGVLPGLDAGTLSQTAVRMAAAREVLGRAAATAAEALADVAHGAITFDLAGFAATPDETRWRLLSAALCRVSGQVYRPRLQALHEAEAAALAGSAFTLHGCVVSGLGGRLRIDREFSAAARAAVPVPGVWDGRWNIRGPAGPGLVAGALGAADLAACPGWRDCGIPRAALIASPAVREAGVLRAVPLVDTALRHASPWSAEPVWDKLVFCADLMSD
ncbi:MAG: tRNA lysidine(34) synthetase TilS [Rhodobacteraceae bacterium]|nr:tRNA lysidine(34) synthetase TilS [Paracoccaceae bacterium]